MLYVRSLSDEERLQVERLTRSSDTVTHRRARIILLSAEGQRVPRIMEALGVSDRTVRDTIHRFNASGVESLPRRKARGNPRACDGSAREALIELLHRPPVEFGVESALWTAGDLARLAVSQGIVRQISGDTVRRELRRAGKSWKRAKRWSTSPDPDYTRKKGRSSD
jgi:transposase